MNATKREKWFVATLCAALVVGLAALSGCAAVAGKAASLAVKPITMFAVADAKTANLLIDREVGAGRLNDLEEGVLRRCPNAVLAFRALREGTSDTGEDSIKGIKGLIYFGVKAKLTPDLKTDAIRHVQAILSSCAELLPAEKLLRLF